MQLQPLPAPVLAVCGFRGAGKTTLLTQVVPPLAAAGLRVAVVKHDAHGAQVDREGKDSDRLFRLGATVLLRAPGESMLRLPAAHDEPLERALAALAGRHDLVLVEGHKDTPLPKVWLATPALPSPPTSVSHLLATLPWEGDRPTALLSLCWQLLRQHFATRPLYGGVLVGGASTRMGRPKHLLVLRRRPLLEWVRLALAAHAQQVVILGRAAGTANHISLPDVPNLTGPLAGILAAQRWHPLAAWLITACDMPALTAEALGWVLTHRRPGVWAVIPAHPDGRLEPLGAVWEPQAAPLLEDLACRGELAPRLVATHDKALTPTLPADLLPAFANLNTPGEVAALRRRGGRTVKG